MTLKKIYHGFYKNFKQHKYSTLMIIIIQNSSSVVNQHIRMISEGSRDTEDWSNDTENLALISQK